VKEGDVILTSVPQADGKTKLRPALLLREFPSPYKDFLVCGISTQLHKKIKNFDDVVLKNDSDFKNSGLLQESLIRLSFLATIPRSHIVGTIGYISPERLQKILQTLSDYLSKKENEGNS